MNVEGTASLDLSTATKLKDVVFSSEGSLRWISTGIETIELKELQQVTVRSWHIFVDYQEWEDFDRLLAQLWTSRSIRPAIFFSREGEMMGLLPELLPESTRKGAVDVFEDGEDWRPD